jgi:O-antigen/teichoic acid export membrane protein
VNSDTLVRIIALCVVLAGAETLHGIARTVFVIPRIGKERAIKLSALTGTLLALAICWLLVPGINLKSPTAHLFLGIVLAAFMASFDIAIGKWLMRKSWAKIWPDFNPGSGNYLLYGLLALCFIPLVVWYANYS